MRLSRGFTLIEVAVCLVILGLLTGTAALSLRDRQHNLDLDTWTERFATLDHQTRERAESQGKPWLIVVDFEQQRIWNEAANEINRDTDSYGLSMPGGWELVTAITQRSDSNHTSTIRGQEVFTYATNQVSHSYALGLRNDNDETLWLMTAGGTGQILTTDHEDDIEDIFAALRAASDDAG